MQQKQLNFPFAHQSSDDCLTVSVRDATILLGVSGASVYRLVLRGHLHVLPGLRHRRITRRSIESYVRGEPPVAVDWATFRKRRQSRRGPGSSK